MNSRHQATLESVFADPVSATIKWTMIEALFNAIGCRVKEGRGSRLRFERDGVVGTFHRPHPGKEAKPYQVRAARAFLLELGVMP